MNILNLNKIIIPDHVRGYRTRVRSSFLCAVPTPKTVVAVLHLFFIIYLAQIYSITYVMTKNGFISNDLENTDFLLHEGIVGILVCICYSSGDVPNEL